MKLSKRVNRISVSPTAAVIMAAERLKAQGVDVVDFGPGEPDFPTPEHIKQAAIQALRDKCDILWAQLDALYFAYVQPGWPPPGAFQIKEAGA